VQLKAPVTTHGLSVGKLTAWLEGSGKSPAEQVLQVLLRSIGRENIAVHARPSLPLTGIASLQFDSLRSADSKWA
jgi:hypothetical protein